MIHMGCRHQALRRKPWGATKAKETTMTIIHDQKQSHITTNPFEEANVRRYCERTKHKHGLSAIIRRVTFV